MTTSDYLINVALIGLVAMQLRGRRLDRRGLLLPLALVAWGASHYLHGIPTVGDDLVMVTLAVAAGVVLGTASGALTRVSLGTDGVPIARATWLAAGLIVVGIGGRMAFAQYTQHGGGPTIARFSIAHHLTPAAWVSALVLMAFAEVVSRTFVLWLRTQSVGHAPTPLARRTCQAECRP